MAQVNQQPQTWNLSDLNALPSKSAKIRYLYSLGESRSEISKILNIRYQHVRNVLITPVKKV